MPVRNTMRSAATCRNQSPCNLQRGFAILSAMRRVATFLALAASALAFAAPLPQPDSADAGAVTNIVFAASPMPGAVTFSLEFAPSPTNNVEIALGTDADGDGDLSAEEECLSIGWDCGSWFVRKGENAEDEYSYSATADGAAKVFSWRLTTMRGGVPSRLVATVDGAPLFSDLSASPPRWLYDTSWNLVRVVVRGAGVDGAVAPVKVSVAGTVFYMR